jgi:hypothetical protein
MEGISLLEILIWIKECMGNIIGVKILQFVQIMLPILKSPTNLPLP